MDFLVAAHTDIGIAKQTNQDSLCVKVANTRQGNVLLAVLCDGMGGLHKGELASATVIREFITWFEYTLPSQLNQPISLEMIKNQWMQIVQSVNIRIGNYGNRNRLTLGTTLSALFIAKDQYVTIHVGDSRIYQLNTGIRQRTTDHTVVAREIAAGRLTREQAKRDPRKNVLIQCVGASKVVTPEIGMGACAKGEEFLLCSDGFRHEISEEEIYKALCPEMMETEEAMKNALVHLVELNKCRKENDNISAALVKLV